MQANHVEKIREFNRFYTRQLGLLNEHLVSSPFSLPEARVMYELAKSEGVTSSTLKSDLNLDGGQLSRIIRDLEQRELVSKKKSTSDARVVHLGLTEAGKTEFSTLNQLSTAQIEEFLKNKQPDEINDLINAMQKIAAVLGNDHMADRSFILRLPGPGDLGWVVKINGELYAREYAWNEEYEGLVAKIVSEFVFNYDPRRERCWIAEKEGENIGAVFLVNAGDNVAKLRLLIVDPKARGLGVGKKLVSECTRFARAKGYQRITLWTNSVLKAARHIYEIEGYKLVKEESHHSFGHDLVGETWELEL